MISKVKTMLAMAAVCSCSLASAQWYVGGTVGASTMDLKSTDVTLIGTTSTSKNESDIGFKAQVGYQFNTNFALEGGYVNLGKGYVTNTAATGSERGDFKSDGWNLMAVGLLPMNRDFSLLGKLGAYVSTTKLDTTPTGTAPSLGSFSKTETNLAYGIGLQYAITKALSVRGEAESFVDLRPSDNSEKRSVNLYSIGLMFKF